MIELTVEHGSVVGDTQEWLADISEPHDVAQNDFDAYAEAHSEVYYVGQNILPWLDTLCDDGHATGLYGEDEPTQACTVNEENWLSSDVQVTFARTDRYGPLLIWQHGYYTGNPVHVCAFNGDDDSDAFSWAGGCAGHEDCDSEWILEKACAIWRNGGGTYISLWDLDQDDDGNMLCPDHGVPLEFYGY